MTIRECATHGLPHPGSTPHTINETDPEPESRMSDTPVFASAAVAAPHRLAAQAGQHVLAQGGNAIEAMTAMAAAIAVVYPHMNGIGGDGFWLVRERGGRVRGSRPAARRAASPRSGATGRRATTCCRRAGPMRP